LEGGTLNSKARRKYRGHAKMIPIRGLKNIHLEKTAKVTAQTVYGRLLQGTSPSRMRSSNGPKGKGSAQSKHNKGMQV